MQGGVPGTFWKLPSQNLFGEPFSELFFTVKPIAGPLLRTLLRTEPFPEPSQNPSWNAVLPYDPLGVHPMDDFPRCGSGNLHHFRNLLSKVGLQALMLKCLSGHRGSFIGTPRSGHFLGTRGPSQRALGNPPPLGRSVGHLHVFKQRVGQLFSNTVVGQRHANLGVAKGSSVSWVAKLKRDRNSECKLSNGWLRSYRVIKLLLSAGK